MASVFSLGACQSGGSGGGGGTGSTTSASSGEAACNESVYPDVHVEYSFTPTIGIVGCNPPASLITIDGIVHYEDGVLHVEPFAPDPALCIAYEYTVGLVLPAGVVAADPPIPAGAFVHLVSSGNDTDPIVHELSITNLPSFDGKPNPVASHGALWLFISAGQVKETVSSPSEQLAVTTPFQCTNPLNPGGSSTFAVHVEAVATGEAVTVEAGGRGVLKVTGGPEAGSYAVVNGGIGDSEGIAFWHDAGMFRLAD
jgi:hypothetical protein